MWVNAMRVARVGWWVVWMVKYGGVSNLWLVITFCWKSGRGAGGDLRGYSGDLGMYWGKSGI